MKQEECAKHMYQRLKHGHMGILRTYGMMMTGCCALDTLMGVGGTTRTLVAVLSGGKAKT